VMVMGGASSAGPGMRSGGDPNSITHQKITPGTLRRIIPYMKPFRVPTIFLLIITAADAVMSVVTPLLFLYIIDDGILPHRKGVTIAIAASIAGIALLDSAALYLQGALAARVGEGLVYNLRTQVFDHVQRQPIAFFTRAQTGSLVSRLNTDVVAAQQAFTTLLSSVLSAALSLTLVLVAMFLLSWQITVAALVLLPLFVLPGRIVGRRLQRLTRETMQLNAEMGSLMHERFNVAGAILAKLYGRPKDESSLFASRAARVRDVAVQTTVSGRMLMIVTTIVAAVATAVVYGIGGIQVIDGGFEVGTLVALAGLLGRLYSPINQLSNTQANVMTALVSFDRIFEVLDLKPLIDEQPGAVDIPVPASGKAPLIEFDSVSFRYPIVSEVSLASLESASLPAGERTAVTPDVLHDVTFTVPPGTLTALVGRSGAGKTTITHLLPRFYDPRSGAIRIDGHNLRDLTLSSVHDAIGVVTQDAHLYHDTIRANLTYARPAATEQELIEACKAAQIWDLISSLPHGLDTVAGDRGYRLSGGEKQRIALARLLLKSPSIVVLDEATAHLDSESEAAIQRALKIALAGRTSVVIAHRLSTIHEADQILVVDDGRIVERGTHEELLSARGLYAELYTTQYMANRKAKKPVPAMASPANGTAGHVSPSWDEPDRDDGHVHDGRLHDSMRRGGGLPEVSGRNSGGPGAVPGGASLPGRHSGSVDD
jgi:ATP-binding cassette, subfamily B, bacterial